MSGFLMLAAFPLMMLANLLLDVSTQDDSNDDPPPPDSHDEPVGDEPFV